MEVSERFGHHLVVDIDLIIFRHFCLADFVVHVFVLIGEREILAGSGEVIWSLCSDTGVILSQPSCKQLLLVLKRVVPEGCVFFVSLISHWAWKFFLRLLSQQ